MSNVDEIDRYIGTYSSLQRKAEEGPLSEEEQEQLALCESVLQKRHELDEFDRWLEEAFGMKLEPHPETCNASVQQVMDPEPKTVHLRHRRKMQRERYLNLLGKELFTSLTKEERQWMAQFEKEFPQTALKLQTRIGPDEELDDED